MLSASGEVLYLRRTIAVNDDGNRISPCIVDVGFSVVREQLDLVGGAVEIHENIGLFVEHDGPFCLNNQ